MSISLSKLTSFSECLIAFRGQMSQEAWSASQFYRDYTRPETILCLVRIVQAAKDLVTDIGDDGLSTAFINHGGYRVSDDYDDLREALKEIEP